MRLSVGAAATLLAGRVRAGDGPGAIEASLRALDARQGGRLGVAVLHPETGLLLGTRLDERFAMCSTVKAPVVALTLARVDRGREALDRRILFGARDLVPPFVATGAHVTDGMTVAELCGAALTVSDSTAANLLLSSAGGPPALTAFLRGIGDDATRSDRYEPSLNVVRPGEDHDTTTPRAMALTLERLLLGDVLSSASRARLYGWMAASTDAAARRLRAGLPDGWRIANKPGTWAGVATNDVGILSPPRRPPIVVAAYLARSPATLPQQESVLADVARIVAGSW